MWSIEKFTDSNEWEQLKKTDSFDMASSFIKTTSVSDGRIFVFWDKEYPTDKKEMEEVMGQLFDLNMGNEIKVFPNTQTKVESVSSMCGCPSRCFCQWDNGSCSCWTSNCRQNGCTWVRCNGSC